MKIKRRLIALFLCLVLIFGSSAFSCLAQAGSGITEAEEITAETVFEEGIIYLSDGVKYRIYNGKAYVVGYDDNLPSELVIKDYIGGYLVSQIKGVIIKNKDRLRSIVLPAGCEEICDYAFADCVNLETVIAKCDYVKIGESAFENTPVYEKCVEESTDNLCILCGKWLMLVKSPYGKNLELSENICAVAKNALPGVISDFTVRNRDCIINTDLAPFAANTVVTGYSGSTAQAFAKKYSNMKYTFKSLCEHDNIITVPESEPDCLGQSGYTEGEYCEICGYISGHRKIDSYPHSDLDGDGVCDLCTADADTAAISGGVYNEIRWVILEDGTLIVSGSGSTGNLKSSPVIESPPELWHNRAVSSKINKLIVREGITDIGQYFFAYSKISYLFEEVILPEGLVSIGNYAFHLTKIKKIEFPSTLQSIGNNAFDSCNMLEEVYLPDSVTTLGRCAFESCWNLKEIRLSDSIKIIPDDAFFNCTSLEKITGGASVISIGNDAFRWCSTLKEAFLPPMVTTVGNSAFYLCTGINEVKIGGKITTLGEYAFYGCSALDKVELSEGLRSISGDAFSKTAIEEISIPNSVTTVDEGVFAQCKNLEKITFGKNTKTIGERVIQDTKVKTVTLPSAGTDFYAAFSGAEELETVIIAEGRTQLKKNCLYGCRAKEIILPESLKTIASEAFSGNSYIEKINLESVEIIGDKAFYECALLTNPTFGENLTEIGQQAFSLCESLTEVTIPSSVRKIGDKAFAFSQNITDAYIKTTICEEMPDGVFMKGVVIHGYERSQAQKYAENNGNEFRLIGTADVTPHDHNFVKSVDGGVCKKTIRYRFTCEICGASYTETENYPYHIFKDEYVVITEATCIDDGLRAKICLCGDEKRDSQKIVHREHTVVVDDFAVAPTETSPGWTQGSHCKVCGTVLETKILVDPDDFDVYVSGDTVTAIKVMPATFLSPGKQTEITFTKTQSSVSTRIKETAIYKIGKVSLSQSSYVCDLKTHKPSVTVLDYCGEKINKNDYTVTYSNAKSSDIGTYTVKVTFKNNYSGEKTLSYAIYPGNVTKTNESASANSVKMSWNAVTGAQGYRIYDNSKKLIADTNETTYVIKNLSGGAKHRFYVRAYKKVGSGVYYSPSFTSFEAVTPPENVKSFTVKSSDEKSVTLKWSVVKNANGYRIYKYNSETKKYTLITDTKKTEYKYSSLSSGREYTVYIKAYSIVDSKTVLSPSYKKLTVSTKPKAPVITLSVGEGTAKISISKVSGADGYEIYMSTAKDGKYEKIASTSKSAYTKKKLKSSKKYYFKVRAYKEFGGKKLYSTYSEVRSVKVK